MAEKEKPQDANDIPSEGNTSSDGGSSGGGGAAVAKPKSARKASPKKKPPQPLPPWKVLLHNDDKNAFEFVIKTICELTPLVEQDALLRTKEARRALPGPVPDPGPGHDDRAGGIAPARPAPLRAAGPRQPDVT
jgi:hypothetical protein